MTPVEREFRRRLAVLAHPNASRNVSKACRFFAISLDTFYGWRDTHRASGDAAIAPRRRRPKKPMPNQYSSQLVEKFLRLPREFSFGAQRIA